jgi:2'-phosphotransferase
MEKKKHDRTLSKALSWALRHSAPSLKLTVSTDGYVPISAILSLKARKFNTYTEDDIVQVAQSNDKKRFRVDTKYVTWRPGKPNPLFYEFTKEGEGEEVLCIRANQGHSIPGICFDELLTLIPPSELTDLVIVHGTNTEAWENHIKTKGLSKMNRNHIHFAPGLPDGKDKVISGMRKSCEVYIFIDGSKCAESQIKFYRSDNGVILSAGEKDGILPQKYFSKVVDAKTGNVLVF